MVRKKTHEEYVRDVENIHGKECSILSTYTSNKNKVLVRHNSNKCNNYEWEVRAFSLLKGYGCPKCGGSMKKTHEEYVVEVEDKYGDEFSILSDYENNRTKVLVRHNSDKCNNYKWEVISYVMLRGAKCPVCTNKKAVLGINTIYDTDRWMCKWISEEDAKKYTHGSGKKVMVKCPDCGRSKMAQIQPIYRHKTIRCSCDDGKSYPEKFISSVLNQLDIDYVTEYCPKWGESRRYDFYISSLNCIIEAHGQQHYLNRPIRNRTLDEEKENDKFKRELAVENGIEHYIEVDCKLSDLEWIKNSIINSKLNSLIDLSKVNWNECAEFANKNIVKEVCEYWNNIKERDWSKEMVEVFKLAGATISKYLKKGSKLNWCDYDPEKERNKCIINNRFSKKVEVFKDEESLGIFNSTRELSRESEKSFGVKLHNSSISQVCLGRAKHHKGYTFRYVEDNI